MLSIIRPIIVNFLPQGKNILQGFQYYLEVQICLEWAVLVNLLGYIIFIVVIIFLGAISPKA